MQITAQNVQMFLDGPMWTEIRLRIRARIRELHRDSHKVGIPDEVRFRALGGAEELHSFIDTIEDWLLELEEDALANQSFDTQERSTEDA